MAEFELIHLDPVTRGYMLGELNADVESQTLVYSRDFNAAGKIKYPSLIRAALESGHIHTLTADLLPALFNETRADKNGRITRLNLADSASKFACGEFNRFYLRGLCLRAMSEGKAELIVCRAKVSTNPRPESEAMVGRHLLTIDLLADLRANKGFGTYLGVPMGPHSGLSAKFP